MKLVRWVWNLVVVAGMLPALTLAQVTLAQEVSCKVVGVSDGDTLTCLTAEHRPLKVRLNQIDAPELGQDFGQVARRRLSALVHGRQVLLRTAGVDRYGRTIATVLLDGTDVNREMLRSGHAWAYRQHLKDPAYLLQEREARAASRGLWSQPDAIYPPEYRHGRVAGEVSRSVRLGDAAGPVSGAVGHAPGAGMAAPEEAGSFRCGEKRFCRQMRSCDEALFYLNRCGLRRLDRDGDGRPCENLC